MRGFVHALAILVSLGLVSRVTSSEAADAQLKFTLPVTIKSNIGRLADVQFSPDGKLLAASSYFDYRGNGDVSQGMFAIWDVETKEMKSGDRFTELPLSDLPPELMPRVRDYPYLNFHSVAFSPDGRLLATGVGTYNKPKDKTIFTGTIILWDVETHRRKKILSGHTELVTLVQFTPDGRMFVSAGSDGVRLWDVGTGKVRATLDATHVSLSGDGKTLAARTNPKVDKTKTVVRLWNVSTAKETANVELEASVGNITLSHDGLAVATTRPAGLTSEILVWDAKTGKLKATLEGHAGKIRDLAYSPDGRWLVSVGGEPIIHYFRKSTGGPGEVKIWDTTTWKALTSFESEDQFTCVAFSHNGRRLASGNLDGTIRLWDLTKLERK